VRAWRAHCGPSIVLVAPTDPPAASHPQVRTVFIAETQLPTRHGSFRLRGYKHSVRVRHTKP
jgi:hypothetical protein